MRLTLWLALFCFCAGLSSVSAQEYEIRMDRPVRAGEKFRMTAKGTAEEKSLIKMGDELVRDDRENFAIDFEATMTVLEVDSQHRPTKAQFVVSKCTKTEAYDLRPLIPPGAVVVAAVKDREAVFTVNGEQASREVGQALDLVITLSKGGATDDEIFGTRSRKKVGDRWGINAELAAKELSDMKFKVAKEALNGATTLEQVVREGGREYLMLATEMTVSPASPELPPGTTLERSKLEMKFTGKYPAEGDAPSEEESADLSLNFTVRSKAAPGEQDVVVESASRQRLRWTYAPVVQTPGH